MNTTLIESILAWSGALFALVVLLAIYIGIARGTRRPVGASVGSNPQALHSPSFYLITSAIFFGSCILLWKPIPLVLSPTWRIVTLVIGALAYFPGMAFVLWARLALGKMYFVSTGTGAQLFPDHRLITHGPFAIVRHPMYTGLSLAVVGGIFLYLTWTTILLLLLPVGLFFRAKREEEVLAKQFGEEYEQYIQRTGRFFPRLKSGGK